MLSFDPDMAYHRVTQVVFLVLLAGTTYGIFGNDALPGNELFTVLALAACAYVGGLIVNCFRFPPLVGMLAVGFLYRNVTFLSQSGAISTNCASILRNISLTIILLKAGLGLDAENLRLLKWVVFRLSLLPNILEAGSSALFAHFILGLPLIWATMLGFILSAVSAAVLVPGALALKEKKIGTEQGVPTLLLASVSLDNITALTGYTVVFSVLISNGSLTWTFFERLLEPLVGLLLGTLCGIFLWYFPNKNKTDHPTVIYYRTALLCFGGLAFTFISKKFEVSGVGALGCVSLAFVASLSWKEDSDIFKNITWITGLLWQLIEPFLFSLIGAEVTINSLQNNIGYGILVLVLGLCVRVIATIMALLRSGLNLPEKIFVSASWISKATVQAAVGSQALDYGKSEHNNAEFLNHANQVLTMAALSIIITAPLGATLMDILGPRLLKKQQINEKSSDDSASAELISSHHIDVSPDYGSCTRTEHESLKI